LTRLQSLSAASKFRLSMADLQFALSAASPAAT